MQISLHATIHPYTRFPLLGRKTSTCDFTLFPVPALSMSFQEILSETRYPLAKVYSPIRCDFLTSPVRKFLT
jgi:hypothetical protein